MQPVELDRRCEQEGAARIIYTDISRDGTRDGVNLDETLKIAAPLRFQSSLRVAWQLSTTFESSRRWKQRVSRVS
jgi:phosphoribosylformimino-5-aminoimidazole carboxamide ribonucleotide (ProFAR) isomerase